MRWIGLDLGTTHLKAVLYDDETRRVVNRASCSTPVRKNLEGAAHDADEIADRSLGLLAEVTASSRSGPPAAGLAIAGLGEEVVLRDGAGQPVDEVLAWYDPRGHDEAALFDRRDASTRRGRVQTDPTFSLFKLMWLRSHHPDAWARTSGVLDLSGHVLARLGAPSAMDWSHASRTGLFDIADPGWDTETLAAADFPSEWLPALVPSGTPVGLIDPGVARRLGLPEDLALVTGGHDHLCGAFACDVRQAGEVYLSAGTSEAQLAVTDGPLPTSAETLDLGRFVDGHHCYVHANVPAGQVFGQWLELLYQGDAGAMYSEVNRIPAGSAGIRFYLGRVGESERLCGLAPTHGRAEIMRAVLEGSALSSARVTELVAGAATDRRRMVVSGQAARNDLWCSLRAGITGRTLEIVDEPEASALGAALLAQRAVSGGADEGVVPRTLFAPSPEMLALGAVLRDAYRSSATGEVTIS